MLKLGWFLAGLLLVTPFIVGAIYRGWQSFMLDRDCVSQFELAAAASSPALAEEKLRLGIGEMERRGLTGGYTSIVYRTPDEDLGFCYRNMTAALNGLERLPKNASEMEQSNVLMKLRETIHHQPMPAGASIYPHNLAFAVGGVFAAVLALVGAIVVVAVVNES